jgi:hypothetical protein
MATTAKPIQFRRRESGKYACDLGDHAYFIERKAVGRWELREYASLDSPEKGHRPDAQRTRASCVIIARGWEAGRRRRAAEREAAERPGCGIGACDSAALPGSAFCGPCGKAIYGGGGSSPRHVSGMDHIRRASDLIEGALDLLK